jgi:hypothetical protein
LTVGLRGFFSALLSVFSVLAAGAGLALFSLRTSSLRRWSSS